LWAEATEKGMGEGVSAKTLWLSGQGAVSAEKADLFAQELDSLVRARGKTRLCLGGEEFHLIPGIPDPPEDGGLARVGQSLGCSFAEAADYAGSLCTGEVRAYVEIAEASAREQGLRLETAVADQELDELGLYLKTEFPGRWEREFRFWRGREDTRHAFWNILRREGKICGFARLGLRGSAEDWCPGALRFPLDEGGKEKNTDACLGPIGISSTERGKGAGKVLLGLSLQLLLHKNAERLCIDWTNAYNYYKPLGLQVVRRYRSAWKDY
jgi:hypothetical protein